MFKSIFRALSSVWRWISPAARNAMAGLVRTVAEDIVNAWFLAHPNESWRAVLTLLISTLMDKLGLKYATAERAIEAAIDKAERVRTMERSIATLVGRVGRLRDDDAAADEPYLAGHGDSGK